jgi:hypothetical protein
MKGLVITILLALLLMPTVSAATIGYGYIIISIVNRPPEITSVSLSPNQPYPDSVLECSAEVDDESPDTVEYVYEWYKNGVLLGENSGELSGFEANDEITCSVKIIDMHDDESELVSVTTHVLEPDVETKMVKTVLKAAGVDRSYEESAELKEEGLLAVTGFVVSEGAKGGGGIGLLLVGIFVLILINLNLVLRYRWKKTQTS